MRQDDANALKAQKLLAQSPMIPENVKATGTEGTPLKGLLYVNFLLFSRRSTGRNRTAL